MYKTTLTVFYRFTSTSSFVVTLKTVLPLLLTRKKLTTHTNRMHTDNNNKETQISNYSDYLCCEQEQVFEAYTQSLNADVTELVRRTIT